MRLRRRLRRWRRARARANGLILLAAGVAAVSALAGVALEVALTSDDELERLVTDGAFG